MATAYRLAQHVPAGQMSSPVPVSSGRMHHTYTHSAALLRPSINSQTYPSCLFAVGFFLLRDGV